jgi:hypothetical protein
MSTQAPAAVTREVARTELRKFLALAALAETPLEMFSALVDDEWHKLVADPNAYAGTTPSAPTSSSFSSAARRGRRG